MIAESLICCPNHVDDQKKAGEMLILLAILHHQYDARPAGDESRRPKLSNHTFFNSVCVYTTQWRVIIPL